MQFLQRFAQRRDVRFQAGIRGGGNSTGGQDVANHVEFFCGTYGPNADIARENRLCMHVRIAKPDGVGGSWNPRVVDKNVVVSGRGVYSGRDPHSSVAKTGSVFERQGPHSGVATPDSV